MVWIVLVLALGLWFAERQASAFAATAFAGASGILEREREAVPFTLFDEANVPAGHAFIAAARWVPFGVGYTLQFPDGRQVECTFRGQSAWCDGWTILWGTPRS
ncbi:MAG: hypothetical protein AAF376_18815 [Pseudomonadota bacterium]